jgi:hypothetical protein
VRRIMIHAMTLLLGCELEQQSSRDLGKTADPLDRVRLAQRCACGYVDHYINPADDRPPLPSLGWRCAHCNHQRPGHEWDCIVLHPTEGSR